MTEREILNRIMTDEDVTMTEMSRMTGVAVPTLCRICKGHVRTSLGSLHRVLDTFGYELQISKKKSNI